jgi:hypothetical protein
MMMLDLSSVCIVAFRMKQSNLKSGDFFLSGRKGALQNASVIARPVRTLAVAIRFPSLKIRIPTPVTSVTGSE